MCFSGEPGATVIYDVKSTRNLKPWILRHGGVPLLWKTGHSLIKGKMKEVGAALAGEMSGHTFFKERWYGFDDGLYAGARLLEILARHADPSALLDALPDAVSTPELNVACAEGEHHALVAKLGETAQFPGATDVIRIDGLRVEYPDGFGLARGSNTTPVIVLRFEADNDAALERIKARISPRARGGQAGDRPALLGTDLCSLPRGSSACRHARRLSKPPGSVSPAASTTRPASNRYRCRS